MDCSPQGSSIHGILQARILEWIAISFSRDLPDPGIETVSCIAGRFFTIWAIGKSSSSMALFIWGLFCVGFATDI